MHCIVRNLKMIWDVERMYVEEELGGIMLTQPININIVLSV